MALRSTSKFMLLISCIMFIMLSMGCGSSDLVDNILNPGADTCEPCVSSDDCRDGLQCLRFENIFGEFLGFACGTPGEVCNFGPTVSSRADFFSGEECSICASNEDCRDGFECSVFDDNSLRCSQETTSCDLLGSAN